MTIAALRQALDARPETRVAIVGRALAQQLFETDELAIEACFYDVPKDEMAAEIVEGRLAEDGVEPEASFTIPRIRCGPVRTCSSFRRASPVSRASMSEASCS